MRFGCNLLVKFKHETAKSSIRFKEKIQQIEKVFVDGLI